MFDVWRNKDVVGDASTPTSFVARHVYIVEELYRILKEHDSNAFKEPESAYRQHGSEYRATRSLLGISSYGNL